MIKQVLKITQTTEKGVSILQLQGRFDYTTRVTFFSAIKNAKETQPQHIILDLSKITFIDSAPISWIVTTFHQLKQSPAIRFTLAGQQGWIDESLKSINLQRLIPTVDSIEEALALTPAH